MPGVRRPRALVLPAAALLGTIGLGLAAAQRIAINPVALRRAPAAAAVPSGPRSPTGDPDGPPPLVTTDEELPEFLEQARTLVERGAYDRGIEILHALITRPEGGFVSAGGGRYVGLAAKANDIIAAMKPEGLKLYRGFYDGIAKSLYEQARRTGDTGLLQQLVSRYPHTSYGPAAIELLGTMYFDRGRFTQAAYCWRKALSAGVVGVPEAALWARIAVAHHLAGERAKAEAAAKTLAERFGGATALLAGQRRNVAEFVAKMLAVPVPDAGAGRVHSRGWPGMGGLPEGQGVMPDCDVVLSARWQLRPPGASEEVGLPSRLLASETLQVMRSGSQVWATPKLRDGHVLAELHHQGSPRMTFHMAATVQPVVADGKVIYRTDEGVVACDVDSAEKVWGADRLPVLRRAAYASGYSGGGGYGAAAGGFIGDSGKYTLTVGGGKLFARFGFLPPIPNRQNLMRQNPRAAAELADTSALTALWVDNGKLAWPGQSVGNGQGDDEVLRAGKFVSPPTYTDGRLYVIVSHVERDYAVCLDADTGSLIWKTPICQPAALPYGYDHYGRYAFLFERGSPPAVADGRVFCLPNIGVLVALEAETGHPLWAYHYPSELNKPAGQGSPNVPQVIGWSVNPVVLARGAVCFLPADGEQLLALSAENGQRLWGVGRQRQVDLTAIDQDSLLLSSPGLMIVSTKDGRTIHTATAAKEIVGRPAVTSTRALASGRAALYSLSLREPYSLRKTDLADGSGLLGNLVSVGDTLIAANTSGLSGYFGFEAARAKLDGLAERADGAERARLIFKRAQLAFSAKAFASALEDLRACVALAERLNETAMVRAVNVWIYRAHIALGNAADDPAERRRDFEQARRLAATDQEKAHMALRLAKHFEQTGEPARAAELAQFISETYGEEPLVDVAIGPDANNILRFDDATQRHAGKPLAQRLIRRLIELHGRAVYAAADKAAADALAKARAAADADAMRAVCDRWPNSNVADAAAYAAAGAYYRGAKAASGDKAGELLAKARAELSTVAGMPDSKLRLPASAALAVLFAREGKLISAGYRCAEVRADPAFDPGVRVSFEDIRGRLGDLLTWVTQRGAAPPPATDRPETFIAPPLAERFAIGPGEAAMILRDQEYRPIMLGTRVLALHGDRALLVELHAAHAEAAVTWSAVSPISAEQAMQSHPPGPGMQIVAGLSRGGESIVISSRTEVRAFDVETAKVRWRRKLADYGIGGVHAMGIAEGLLVAADTGGNVVGVDLDEGELRWLAHLHGGNPHPIGPPMIGAGVALVGHNGPQQLTCFDLLTGKVVGAWRATGGRLQGLLTRGGLLAIMDGGRLTVREIQPHAGGRRITEPIWERRFGGGPAAAILAVSEDRIAVSANWQDDRIEVFAITGGSRPTAVLEVGRIDEAPALPVEAVFDDDSLYVVCGRASAGWRKYAYGRWSYWHGMNVQKFALSSQRRLWQVDLNTNPQSYYLPGPPLTIGRDHVVVSARQANVSLPSDLFVLDAATGAEAMPPVDLRGQGNDQNQLARRLQSLGPAVMTAGRLCVETCGGLRVYGTQEQ